MEIYFTLVLWTTLVIKTAIKEESIHHSSHRASLQLRCALLSLGTSAFCCVQPREPSPEPLVPSWRYSRAASCHAGILGSWSQAGLHAALQTWQGAGTGWGEACQGNGHENILLLPAVDRASLGGPLLLSGSRAAPLCFRHITLAHRTMRSCCSLSSISIYVVGNRLRGARA